MSGYTVMSWFRVTPFSHAPLAFLTVASVLLFYLLKGKKPTRTSLSLAGYVAFAALMALSHFVRSSVAHPVSREYGPFAEAIVFGMVCLFYFSLHFANENPGRAQRIASISFFAASIVMYVADFFYSRRIGEVFTPESHDWSFKALPSFTYFLALGFVTTILTFFYRAGSLSAAECAATGGEQRQRKPSAMHAMLTPFVFVFRGIAGPTNADAETLRSFGLIAAASFLLSLVFLRARAKVISMIAFTVVVNTGMVAVLLAVFVVYTNASPEFTSFQHCLRGSPSAWQTASIAIRRRFWRTRTGCNRFSTISSETHSNSQRTDRWR